MLLFQPTEKHMRKYNSKKGYYAFNKNGRFRQIVVYKTMVEWLRKLYNLIRSALSLMEEKIQLTLLSMFILPNYGSKILFFIEENKEMNLRCFTSSQYSSLSKV